MAGIGGWFDCMLWTTENGDQNGFGRSYDLLTQGGPQQGALSAVRKCRTVCGDTPRSRNHNTCSNLDTTRTPGPEATRTLSLLAF